MRNFYFKGLRIRYQAPSLCSDRAIILCPGLPASSTNEERIDALVQKNFHVFQVLYPGYPNSSKTRFLSQNPSELISEFITFLRSGGIQGSSLSKVFLIGSSFGGSVALDVPNAEKIVDISPVIDYKNLYNKNPNYNYGTLKKYLTKNGYRISDSGWQKLKMGQFFNLSYKEFKEKTLIVYSRNDSEINPYVLRRFLKLKNIESICINSDKHLSFKSVQLDIFEDIVRWLDKTSGIRKYNDIVNHRVRQFISKISEGSSAALIGGSLASENLVLESDIDIYFISDRNATISTKKINDHVLEFVSVNFDEFIGYVRGNMRGVSKLFCSTIITSDHDLQRKIQEQSDRVMDKYKKIFLVFQLLEKKRMENIAFSNPHSALAIKKGAGGRRSLGFMVVTFNALNNIKVLSFWNTLEIMLSNRVITRRDKNHIEHFFNKLIAQNFGLQELDELLKNNDKIIDKYINSYFLKNINKTYKLGLTIKKDKVCVNVSGFIGDMLDAFYSENPERLAKLTNKYKNYKDAMKKYIIFYYLALNNNLLFKTGEFIALNFINEYSMHNIRRNLIENSITTTHRDLLLILANDPNHKVRHYAKQKLKKGNILQAEIMRYSG